MKRRDRPSRLASVGASLLLLPVLLAASCLPKAPQKTELMQQVIAADRTTTQLRLEAHAFGDRFAGLVEQAADEIIARTDDPEVMRNAILWKANAIPACHRAVLQYDPLAALIDAWVLTLQMEAFFETGAGRTAFGPHQAIALDVTKTLIAEARELARSLEFIKRENASRNIFDWVREHPLESMAFNRVSPSSELASLVMASPRGVGEVMGSLDEGIADLADRSAIYARYLPRQLRWEGQLIADEILEDPRVAGPLASVAGIEKSIDRTAGGIEELPQRVITETGPLLDLVRDERAILTAFVERQRLETLAFAQQERITLTETVRAEREATLAMLHDERVDTLDRLESLVEATHDRSLESVGGLIDRVLWRATLYAGGLLILLGALAVAGLRILGFGR